MSGITMNPNTIPAIGKSSKAVKVLDLASWGAAAKGYFQSREPQYNNVDVKSIARLEKGEKFGKEKETSRSISIQKNGGILPKVFFKKVALQRSEGTMPDCLASEPKEYYDHVHFHMLPGYGKVGIVEIEPMIGGIASTMKDGGLLFFSINIDFVSQGAIDRLHVMNQSVLGFVDSIINDRFQVIFRFCDADMMIENGNNAELAIMKNKPGIFPVTSTMANGIATEFGANRLVANRASVNEFYSKFSDDAPHVAEYFIIAKSRSDIRIPPMATTRSILAPYENETIAAFSD